MKEGCKGGGGGGQLRNSPSIPSYVIPAKLSFLGKGKREHNVKDKRQWIAIPCFART